MTPEEHRERLEDYWKRTIPEGWGGDLSNLNRLHRVNSATGGLPPAADEHRRICLYLRVSRCYLRKAEAAGDHKRAKQLIRRIKRLIIRRAELVPQMKALGYRVRPWCKSDSIREPGTRKQQRRERKFAAGPYVPPSIEGVFIPDF